MVDLGVFLVKWLEFGGKLTFVNLKKIDLGVLNLGFFGEIGEDEMPMEIDSMREKRMKKKQ